MGSSGRKSFEMSKFLFGLLAIILIFVKALAISEKCCQAKTVGGKKYVLVDPEGSTPESCKDSCVYGYANAENGERFCFRPGNLISECHSDSDSDSTTTATKGGVLIVEGYNREFEKKSSEVYNPRSGTSCSIGDGQNDEMTMGASLCNGLLCGGSPSRRSCRRLESDGTLRPLELTLVDDRFSHLCWGLSSGEVLLIGGLDSGNTTELVSADRSSSSKHFDLAFDHYQTCGIDLGDRYVVVGGLGGQGEDKVSQYSLTGEMTYLPGKLNTGRYGHSCSQYKKDRVTILLVTGGLSGEYLSSTEIYVDSEWKYVASLPTPRELLALATINNTVFAFGGEYEGVYYDDILRYDSAGDRWEDAGKMNFPRSQHAVATLEDISQFCN